MSHHRSSPNPLRGLDRERPPEAVRQARPASSQCPFCDQPPPCWRLTRRSNAARPQVYACKGCGIVFNSPDRFYLRQKPPRTSPRPGQHTTLRIGMCDDCGLIFIPQLWLRNMTLRDLKRYHDRQRR